MPQCENCLYYEYDEEFDDYLCTAALDMDDLAGLYTGEKQDCPFYRPGDEYTIVRKQN